MEYDKQVARRLNERLLKVMDDLVTGAGDGRIAKLDAEKVMEVLVSGNTYTSVEKETIQYAYDNYHWTDAALSWFCDQLKRWITEFETPTPMSPAEISKQRFSSEDVLSNDTDREVREHGLRSATNETYLDHDDITLIVRLANGRRAAVTTNFIELAGSFVELKGGHDIPLKAVEKVEI
jgi:hypothetical protein